MDHTLSGTKYIVLERMAARFSWQGKGKGTKALRVVLQEEQAKLNRLEDGGNSQQIEIQFEPRKSEMSASTKKTEICR